MNDNRLTPKADFLKDKKAVDAFAETVMNPQFRYCAEVAFAEYALRQLAGNDPRSGYRLAGARDMLNTLMNLGNANFVPVQDDEFPALTPT